MSTFKEIWETLSSVDCSAKIEKKNGMTYLSWAWAWGVMMQHYPNASYSFKEPLFFNDGTCEIWCEVTVEGNVRQMWLPVMDHKNMAVVNPNTRKVSDTRMRCLVKCFAMFGLGHYIYAGEDLPESNEEPNAQQEEVISKTQAAELRQKLVMAGLQDEDFERVGGFKIDTLPISQFKGALNWIHKQPIKDAK